MNKFISFFCAICITLPIFSQGRHNYWDDVDTYMQDQAEVIFEQAYKVLSACPPGTTVSNERKLALFSLDVLLHDTRLDKGRAFLAYMNSMAESVVAELQKNKPLGNNIRIIRYYNHGFIVQTSGMTIAFDLVRGGKADNTFVSETLMRSIADQCDILFITHIHADHADRSVAKMFTDQGKNVIVPEEWWTDMSPHLLVMRGTDVIQETIRVSNKDLKVRVYPGNQSDIKNNVYMVTLPEEQTIMHTGDQSLSEDLFGKVAATAIKTDVLLVQCWMNSIGRFVSGVNPDLVICGHENEMGHTIDHREPYWLTFRRMSEVKIPYIVMAWGESYTIKR